MVCDTVHPSSSLLLSVEDEHKVESYLCLGPLGAGWLDRTRRRWLLVCGLSATSGFWEDSFESIGHRVWQDCDWTDAEDSGEGATVVGERSCLCFIHLVIAHDCDLLGAVSG